MFNWICPECGRDVPPSATECRFCAERKKAAESASATADTAAPAAPPADYTTVFAAPPPTQQYAAPPQPYTPPQQPPQQPPYAPPPQQYAPPPQPQYAPPQPQTQQPYYPPPPQPHYAPPAPAQQPYYQQPDFPPQKAPLPTWALALIFGLGFIVLIGGIFYGYQYFGKGPRAERAGVTEPAAAARSNKTSNPVQKYIEVVGIRLVQDPHHHPEAKFIVVNHSSAELNDLNANVTLWASTSRSEEDSVGTFSFKLDSIAGDESKEITAPLNTKLKIYELPDWQNATAEVQLTTP